MRIPYNAPMALGSTFIELTEDVVAAILLTIKEGWDLAVVSADVHSRAGEVPMTERLRDGMRASLRVKDHPWGKVLMILPGTESRSSPSVLMPDGRTDIPIVSMNVFLRTQEHDPHAILECKRISGGDTHLCREYVVEGMDRFRGGKYGANHAAGFMVGYVISGTSAEAVIGLNSYLNRSAREAEYLHAEATAPVTSWYSIHPRTTPSSPIRLCHSFLSVAA